MNSYEIKLEIIDLISKANIPLTNWWGRLYSNGLLGEEKSSLEVLLKKVTRTYKLYNILTIICTPILLSFSILKYYDLIDFGNMNKAGLFIFFNILFIFNTHRYYRIKVNLENKINLLGLRDRIDS